MRVRIQKALAIDYLRNEMRMLGAASVGPIDMGILEQLETMAHELVKAADGITIEALRRQAEGLDEHAGTADP